MRSAQRSPTPWRLLIAALAIAATTASARADLLVSFYQGPSHTLLGTKTFSGSSGSDSFSFSTSSSTPNDVTLNYSVSSSQTGSTSKVTLSGDSLTGTAHNAMNVQISVATFNPPPPPPGLNSGYFTNVTNASQLLLYSTLSATIGGGASASPVFQTQAQYTGYDSAGHVQQTIDGDTITVSQASPNAKESQHLPVLGYPTYNLTSMTTTFTLLTGSVDGTSFSASAVAMPEPSGVVAAFAGLPCMGVLLGFARRFRGRNSQPATV